MVQALPGEDGFLFLDGDSNRLRDQLAGAYEMPEETLDAIFETHLRRAATARECGADYRHIVVPDKERALAAWLPADLRAALDPARSPLRRYLDRHPESPGLFYDVDYLRALTAKAQIYARQDTHWTHVGAHQYFLRALAHYDARRELAAYRGLPLRRVEHESAGDLGVRLGLSPERLFAIVLRPPRPTLAVDNRIDNVGRVRLYRAPHAPTRLRALVLHDSVANWLTTPLSALHRETLFLHGADLDHEFVARYAPDRLYVFQIERFFVRPPQDGLDVAAETARLEAEKGSDPALAAAPLLARIRSRPVWRGRLAAFARRSVGRALDRPARGKAGG